MEMFAAHSVSARTRTVLWRLQQRGRSARQPLLRFPWQCNIEKDGDSGASNDKDGCRKGTILSFFDESPFCMQYFDSRIHVQSLRRERRRLLAFYIVIGTPCTWWDGLGNHWVMTWPTLIRIDNNSKMQIGTFLTSNVQLLCLVLEACQMSSSNKITHGNMLHVCSDLSAWSRELSHGEKMVMDCWETAQHFSPVNTVDKMWHNNN